MKNKRFTAKILIDIGMTICLLLLMPYSLLSETAHEWIGMAMLATLLIDKCWTKKFIRYEKIDDYYSRVRTSTYRVRHTCQP